MASAGSMPCTTDTFTPAFSNVSPSCITQVTPPPPSERVQRSTRNFSFGSSFSSARQKSACVNARPDGYNLVNLFRLPHLNFHNEQLHFHSDVITIIWNFIFGSHRLGHELRNIPWFFSKWALTMYRCGCHDWNSKSDAGKSSKTVTNDGTGGKFLKIQIFTSLRVFCNEP